MDIVFAALLMIWGNVSGSNPDVTFEQMVQASLDAKQPLAVEIPIADSNGNEPVADVDGFTKIDPAPETPVIKGVYATAHTAGGKRMEELVKLLDETELNA